MVAHLPAPVRLIEARPNDKRSDQSNEFTKSLSSQTHWRRFM